MGLFSDNKSQNQSAALARVDIKEDGFTIHKQGNKLRDGDTLLVTYRTEDKNWKHVAVEFYDRREGIFVFTEKRPKQVIIQEKKAVEKSRSVQQAPRSSYSSDDGLFGFNDPFSLMNFASPFHPWNFSNPIGFMNLFDLTSPYQAQDSSTPDPYQSNPPDLTLPPLTPSPSSTETNAPEHRPHEHHHTMPPVESTPTTPNPFDDASLRNPGFHDRTVSTNSVPELESPYAPRNDAVHGGGDGKVDADSGHTHHSHSASPSDSFSSPSSPEPSREPSAY